MRLAGKKQMTVWADPAQQAAIVAFLAGTGELPLTTPQLRVTHPPRIKRRRKITYAGYSRIEGYIQAYHL